MKSKADLEAYAIMYAIQNKKGDIVALLLKNGVVVPSSANDMQIALVVTEMLKKSKSFTRDFKKLIQSKDLVSGLTSNMSGSYYNMGGAYSNAYGFEYDTTFDPTDPLFKSLYDKVPSNTSTPTTKSATNNGVISGFEKYLLYGQGLFSDYTKLKENEAKVKLANASVELEKLNKIDNVSTGTTSGSKTIYVVLGLAGVSLLGFITYKLVKK